jgi:DNA-binding NtrC family response regulator
MGAVILVIENEDDWQQNLKRLLTADNFEVILTKTYPEAKHKILDSNPKPTLAIVDLRLDNSLSQGNDDGILLLYSLRDHGIHGIILSGYTRAHEERLAGRAEIRPIVDKHDFDFTGAYLMPIVRDAVAYAEADRQAEGQLLAQQQRLYDAS